MAVITRNRKLYTPGQSPGKPEIKRYDKEIHAEYSALVSFRAELSARLEQVNRDIGQAKVNLGGMVANRCDWSDIAGHLAELRLEHEALELGYRNVDGQVNKLVRNHYWLKGLR